MSDERDGYTGVPTDPVWIIREQAWLDGIDRGVMGVSSDEVDANIALAEDWKRGLLHKDFGSIQMDNSGWLWDRKVEHIAAYAGGFRREAQQQVPYFLDRIDQGIEDILEHTARFGPMSQDQRAGLIVGTAAAFREAGLLDHLKRDQNTQRLTNRIAFHRFMVDEVLESETPAKKGNMIKVLSLVYSNPKLQRKLEMAATALSLDPEAVKLGAALVLKSLEYATDPFRPQHKYN